MDGEKRKYANKSQNLAAFGISLFICFGTVAVFMIVYVLYEMQKWLIDNASPFEDVPSKTLNEWLSREKYTEKEQGLLKKRLIRLKLLKEREAA